jgi:iron complex transport system ATP-binding protein
MSALLDVRALSLHAGARASGRRLFGGLDFSLHARERWVVLGPNGSGKSTLLAALAGLLPVQGGRIDCDGRPLADWSLADLAGRRAWCPQFWIDPFPARVDETVRLARLRIAWDAARETGAEREALAALLERLDIGHLADHDVRTLSGGERQRVAIATALWQDAPLLLLDEPTSHLDLAHQQRLLASLHEHAASGGAVVASMHDMDLAWSLASHAVLLDGRGGAAAGARDDVLTPARLSAAFGVAVQRVEVCGEQRFWIGPAKEVA